MTPKFPSSILKLMWIKTYFPLILHCFKWNIKLKLMTYNLYSASTAIKCLIYVHTFRWFRIMRIFLSVLFCSYKYFHVCVDFCLHISLILGWLISSFLTCIQLRVGSLGCLSDLQLISKLGWWNFLQLFITHWTGNRYILALCSWSFQILLKQLMFGDFQ